MNWTVFSRSSALRKLACAALLFLALFDLVCLCWLSVLDGGYYLTYGLGPSSVEELLGPPIRRSGDCWFYFTGASNVEIHFGPSGVNRVVVAIPD